MINGVACKKDEQILFDARRDLVGVYNILYIYICMYKLVWLSSVWLTRENYSIPGVAIYNTY